MFPADKMGFFGMGKFLPFCPPEKSLFGADHRAHARRRQNF